MTIHRKDFGFARAPVVIATAVIILLGAFLVVWFLPVGKIEYSISTFASSSSPLSVAAIAAHSDPELPPESVVTHVKTPNPLKGVYMTSWAAGNAKFRAHLFDLVDSTEVNAVVIDVKDYSGRISFEVSDPKIAATGAVENRIPDIKEFIAELHKKNVYVIARISSFQDSFLINVHPEWAVKTEAGNIWQDYKGVKWLDAGAKPVWDYLVAIGKEAYSVGFDELNFDYIRYPSDGNLKDIAYSWSEGRSRIEVMRDFFQYINKQFSGTGIPISADLFGLTTSANDDLGIGQVLEHALENFDYVMPMVYPSHFGKGYMNLTKPAQFPYEVIQASMSRAIAKAEATTTPRVLIGIDRIASTSPQLYTKNAYDKNKLRPWLQAFDLGGVYTPAMVRDQIRASNELGLHSWILWNAGSVYKKDALLSKELGRQ
jgi:hypothetical protein